MKRILIFIALVCSYSYVMAQFTLKGTVRNELNSPIQGAIVLISNTKNSGLTDSDGSFNLKSIEQGKQTLVVSYLGFKTYSEEIDFTMDVKRDIVLSESYTRFEEVVVSAVRAQNSTPTTYTLLTKREISLANMGQDAPFLLAMEPSVVVTSDAGTGIGYTGMRIRGVDAFKINVTINGVPLNDPESHGVFWVDVPDVASSAQSIQIQRGVGTSTNGSGAFGASINMQTDHISQSPFVEYSGAAGSFNTLKNSIHFGTGLFKDHWFFEGKVTGIKSDGYVDRGWSNLKSYFAQTGYYSDKTMVKLVSFGGWEETYQAWYGIDSTSINDYGRTFNWAGAYTDTDGSSKFYQNFIDHYQQDHLQLHFAHKFNDNLSANAALHYTYGRGYYEELSQNEDLNFYNFPYQFYGLDSTLSSTGTYDKYYKDTVKTTDLIRRLWLDNDFYGGIWGVTYTADKLTLTWGGGVNRYANAKHYGEVIWARSFPVDMPGKQYYNNVGQKDDLNTFLKTNYQVTEPLSVYADLQYRYIHYTVIGLNKEYADQLLDIDRDFLFFNPKAGLLYKVNKNTNLYTSFAIANREPNRGDFIDAQIGETPKPERLYNTEIGLRHGNEMYFTEVVFFDMQYRDQLVLTGALNSVGSPIRKNVGISNRTGIELVGSVKPVKMLKLDANLTLSQNKTDYNEQVTDSTVQNYNNVNIAFSPEIIAGSKLTFMPFDNFETSLLFKHVGKQYIDNTQNESRILNSYSLFDFLCSYSQNVNKIGIFNLNFKINNLFDTEYISNATMYGTTPMYFPQAKRNFMVGLTVRF